jgi:hypothetical protein
MARGLTAGWFIRRLSSLRPTNVGSAAAADVPRTCAPPCGGLSVDRVTRPRRSAQRPSVFARGVRPRTRLHADRLDRPVLTSRRDRPVASRSRLVRLARKTIGCGVSSTEDRHRPASALSRALAEKGPSCALPNSTIQEGSLDHDSELHQRPRPPRPSPARGPTPSPLRQGPTRGSDPPGRLSFQAAAHPGDLTRRRSDGCRPFPAPIHLAWPTGGRSCSDRRRSCQC